MSEKITFAKETAIRTIVQIVLINETGDSYHRMRWPAAQLAKQEPNLRIINLDAQAEERFIWAEAADLLVLYQSSDLELLPIIARRRAQGKKTIVEYNDNFYEAPPSAPVFGAWSSPLLWQIYEKFMQEADAVIVTGPGLKKLFSEVTRKPIFELANHFPNELKSFPSKSTDTLVIAWAGSVGHMADLLWCLPTLERIVEREPSLRLHLMGTSSIPEFVRLAKNKFEFTAWAKMDDYFKFWRNANIGIAPLLDSSYNNCRSDVKAIEMSAQGVLPLLSRRLPYLEFLKQTELASFETLAELETLLIKFITHRHEITQAAERAFNYVRTKRIGQANKQRLELYLEYLAEPSAFNFELGPGYFEVFGTKEQNSRFQLNTNMINSLVNEGKLSEACNKLHELVTQNPHHADLNLAYIKCLIRLNNKSVLETLSACKNRFPRDMRFRLLELQNMQTPVEGAWRSLICDLKQSRKNEQSFFEAEVVKIFASKYQNNSTLDVFISELLEIYPNNFELCFISALYNLVRGQDAKARQQFEKLKDALTLHKENQEFLSRIDFAFVETWSQALKNRLEN